MSGRGGVGSRERPRLAGYPAVPASLAGCRDQAQGAGLFHLAGARSRPCPVVEMLSWGGNRPRRLQFHSTLPPSRRQPWPDLPRASRSRSRHFLRCGRPPLLSPGAAAAAAAVTEPTRPAPRARGEGAGIGGDTPSEAGGGFSLTHSAGVTVRAISFPSPPSPQPVSHFT